MPSADDEAHRPPRLAHALQLGTKTPRDPRTGVSILGSARILVGDPEYEFDDLRGRLFLS